MEYFGNQVECLEIPTKKLIEKAMKTLEKMGVPSHLENPEDRYNPGHKFTTLVGLTQEEILDTDIMPMIEEGPKYEIGHPLRVAIIGTGISKMLHFKRDQQIEFFLLGTSHDLGKLKVSDYYPEKNLHARESESYKIFMKKFMIGHVNVHNVPSHWGERVSSAIESSHSYQKSGNGPYPLKKRLPQTAESELLSKLLAIPDYLDAVIARPSRETHKYMSSEEAINLAIKEYGDLVIKYSGKIYPKVDTCGKEIIQELHRQKLIGVPKPNGITEETYRMNPFVN